MTETLVNQTIGVDALDHPATITKTTAGAPLEAGNFYSIPSTPTWTADPRST